MDDLDFTEKTPREFDDEDATTGVGGDDIPIHVAAPMRGSELPALSRTRAARGTRTRITIPPPIPGQARRATTLPPPLPGGARRATTVPPVPLFSTTIGPAKLIPFLPPPDDDAPSGEIVASPPPPVAIPRAPSPLVIVAPLPPPFPRAPIAAPPPPPMFDEPHLTAAPLAPLADLDLESNETDYYDRSEPQPKRNVAGIIGIAVGAVVVVVILGLGLRGGSSDKVAASASPPPRLEVVTPPVAAKPVVAPRPAPAPRLAPPVVAPTPAVAATVPARAETAPARVAAAAASPAPETASMPITSEPAGAVVTLIADGNATIVGRTPVIAEIDPSHTYDVVVALRDHPTKVTHVDPRRTRALSFDLVETSAATTEPAPTPTRRSTRSTTPTRSAAPKSLAATTPPSKTETPPARPTSKKEPAVKTPAPKTVATASPAAKPAAIPAGSGVLMVSAKPPCEIAIDGKVTHLITPQRSIALLPGTHSVTLVNAQQKITKTFSVKIVAKQPTKLIQDFTQR